jgi:hypothetical protein
MENLTSFISSRGILKSCDRHNKTPISSSNEIDSDLVLNLDPNSSIYICSDAIINFCTNFFPKIKSPFNLISGDSDLLIDDKFIDQFQIKNLLASDLLINWFAQNCTANRSKLAQLPIGLDYHTMWENPGLWGLSVQSPIAQEKQLLSILSTSKDLSKRYFLAYSNWHFAINRGDRKVCFETLNPELCFYEKNHLPRESTWRRQSEFMFVISPEGAGLDCHRTWETILLGSIPVVKKSPFTNIFENLPVLQLDSWSDLTTELLLQTLNNFMSSKFDFQKLFLKKWINKINGKDTNLLNNLTMEEFKKILGNSYP